MTLRLVEPSKPRSPSAGKPKRVTDAEWDRFIAAFRQFPGQTQKVSEIVGTTRNRARIAWYHGWPKQGRPAICELLEDEKVLARAERFDLEVAEDDEEELVAEVVSPGRHSEPPVDENHKRVMDGMLQRDLQRRKVLADSLKTRAEEGQLVRESRKNSVELAQATAKLLHGVVALSAHIGEKLASEKGISIKEGMTLIQKAAVITRLGNEASKMALQMERLVLGQPVGDETGEADTGKLSPKDALKWIEMTMKAVKRYETRTAGGGSDAAGPSKPAAAGAGRESDDADDSDALATVGRPALN